jgi:Domain of Unknown Function (DUF349)
VSDGPEQTTAETVHATEEVSTTESAVPEFAAAEPAEGVGTAAEAHAPVVETPAEESTGTLAETHVTEPVVAADEVAGGTAAEESGEAQAEVEAEVGAGAVVEALVEAVVVSDTAVVTFETAEADAAEAPVAAEAQVVETPVETPVVAVVETTVVEVPSAEGAVAEAVVVEAVVVEAAAVEASAAEAVAPAEAAEAAAPPAADPLASAGSAPAEPLASAEAAPADPLASAEGVSASPAEPAAPAPLPEPVVTGPASSQWGRVTEEGTVFAIAADGTEREIGNWAAGTPTEGLAFYERKFASLKGEVDLLNKRVHGPGLSAKDAEATIVKLREQLADAHAIGDLAGLSARLDKIGRIAEQKQAARKEARAKLQAEAAVTKEALVAEAEGLAESQQWKSAGERLRILVDEWKAAPRLDRKADDELWSRFAAARGTFAKRRKAHFAQLDAQRDEVKSRKEDLVAEAESMADSTDWADTAQRFRNLMQQWKTAGRAQRETEDKLWGRFKSAQDTFFAARNADLDQRDAGFKENGVAKEALLAEAQKLVPVTDVKTAKSALRSIHARWESIGMVPREDKGRIEGALRDVERAVADAEQAEWKRTNPEARARAQATVDQLRTSISKFEKELTRATEAGQTKKIADAEAAIAARQEWLAQAQAALDEFTR